jgi:UDP-glucuronate decarboxylase
MIRWISAEIGTAAFDTLDPLPDAFVLDVRELLDKGGNSAVAVRLKIDEALAERRAGRPVVVCCDYGISRSSAIAAGVIAAEEGISYDDAVQRVVDTTGEKAIRIEVLDTVRAALEDPRQTPTPGPSRSILVTGGSGFLGRELASRLRQAYGVTAPTRDEVDLGHDAVALDRLVRERDIDTVVHLANPRIYTTNASLGATLTQLKNVVDVCALHDVHLVFPSGWEVFSGYRATRLLVDESVPPRPGSGYGHAKLLCEHLLAQVHAQTGLRHTVVRIAPVYGPSSTRPKFIWNFVDKALLSAPIVTHRYRNGEPTLDLIHVEDVLAALLAIVEQRPETVLHVGTGVATSTAELARMLVSLTESSSTIDAQDVDGYAPNIVMESGKAQATLGWAPTHALADGLRELIQTKGIGP